MNKDTLIWLEAAVTFCSKDRNCELMLKLPYLAKKIFGAGATSSEHLFDIRGELIAG